MMNIYAFQLIVIEDSESESEDKEIEEALDQRLRVFTYNDVLRNRILEQLVYNSRCDHRLGQVEQ